MFLPVEDLLRDPGLCNQGQHGFTAEHSVNHYLSELGWVVTWHAVLRSKPIMTQLSQRTANIGGHIRWAKLQVAVARLVRGVRLPNPLIGELFTRRIDPASAPGHLPFC